MQPARRPCVSNCVEIQTLRLEPGGPSWPKELSEVEDPPSVLWARGRLELLARKPRVAVVGSRAPSPYGEAQAERFGEALARAGVVVVSGLARGVDQAAHAGALAANGSTLAVLGCGVDRPWPPGPITERMLEEGLVLSEYQPGTPPRRGHGQSCAWRRRVRELAGRKNLDHGMEAQPG